jgi:hypothetical protein
VEEAQARAGGCRPTRPARPDRVLALDGGERGAAAFDSCASVAGESSCGSAGRSTRAAVVGTQFGCSAPPRRLGKNDSPKRTVCAWAWRNGSSARFSSLQRVGQTFGLQGLSSRVSRSRRAEGVVQPGSVASMGWSIDPDLSTSTITFGLNFLMTIGVLLSSCEIVSGPTGTNS